ncbi:hypothetical protein P5673_021546, partial [Acropora cervicornis]
MKLRELTKTRLVLQSSASNTFAQPTSWYTETHAPTLVVPLLQHGKIHGAQANLVVIKSSVENQFVCTLTSGGRSWFGLPKKADNSFYWVNDRTAQGNYQNWDSGEPNDSGGSED